MPENELLCLAQGACVRAQRAPQKRLGGAPLVPKVSTPGRPRAEATLEPFLVIEVCRTSCLR